MASPHPTDSDAAVSPGSQAAPARYRIVIIKNGPFIIHGQPPLVQQFITPDDSGHSWTYRAGQRFELEEPAELCRCGHSQHKPFCDGSHKRVGFDGTETASLQPILDGAKVFDGPTLRVSDNPDYCANSRFCDGHGSVWKLVLRSDDPQTAEYVLHETHHCPSGRLLAWDVASGVPLEALDAPELGLIEDPSSHSSGPLWVRGGIAIQSADGSVYEIRNRVTLCRCGHSQNKPFCDGSHADAQWQDGLPGRPDGPKT